MRLRREVRGVSYRAPGVTRDRGHSRGRTPLFGRLQGTDIDYHVDPGAHVRGRAVLHAPAGRRPREGRRAVVDGRGTSCSVRRDADRPDDRDARTDVHGHRRGRRRAGGFGGRRTRSTRSSCPTPTLQDVLRIAHLHNVLVSVESAGESSRVSQRHRARCCARAISSVPTIPTTSP